MNKNLPKIIIICGPTGIGKTALTIDIFQKFPSIIISADSVQVYKHMDIGTAKLTPEENKTAPHQLIDICSPDEDFDAGKFSDLASNLIHDAHDKGKTSIITGGTGLYIKALIHGIFRSRPADKEILEYLYSLEKENGTGFLFNELKKVDPKAASKIHQNDTFRLARAIECFMSTGIPISQKQDEDKIASEPRFDYLKIGLNMDRKLLYTRIDKRVDIMLDQGLLNEVAALREMGFSKDLKSMGSIGYKHMNMFLDNEVSFDEAVSLMKRDTRRYAKRQLTWFNADDEIKWIAPDDLEKAEKLIRDFLGK